MAYRSISLWIIVFVACSAYAASLGLLRAAGKPPAPSPELLVTVPRVVQVVFAAGDRYLAANLGGFRVLVADTARMKREDYAVQARVQQDVSWLNPAHEDNYYIAANILPWGGDVDAAEEVLRRAGIARPTDFLPFFHVGFIWYHFHRSPAEGAKWIIAASERATSQLDRWGLQTVAAKWIERGYQTATAAQMVDSMARSAPPGGFRRYLETRARRLQMLSELRAAAKAYQVKHGRPAREFQELIAAGLLPNGIPKDPLGIGFVILASGEPAFAGN